METARYIFGVMTVIAIPPALVWWYLVHPFVDFWRKIGAAGTITVLAVLTVVGMLFLFPLRDMLLMRDLGTNGVMIGIAAVLVTLGMTIALKRRKQLTPRILSGIPELEAGGRGGTLLTEGIYAVVRHPRYIEIVVITLGYACFANYLGTYIVALLTIPALHGIVIFEERELEDRFGDEYRAYKARVPRYLPRRG